MSENNPFAAPQSNVEQTSFGSGESVLLATPTAVPAGRGWGWIADGFGYFKRSPLGWILGMLVGFILLMVLMFIPVIGQIIYFLIVYILVGGVMLGCHAQSSGQPFEVKHVFSAFQKPGKLILLSLLMLVITMVAMLVIMGPSYFKLMTAGSDPAAASEAMAAMGGMESILLKTLFSMLIFIPISMAVWFAPALIAINDLSVIQALKTSFKGCLKNLLPFLLFGIIGILLYILAVIPLGLGLFVFLPTFTAASYVAYREIFTEKTT